MLGWSGAPQRRGTRRPPEYLGFQMIKGRTVSRLVRRWIWADLTLFFLCAERPEGEAQSNIYYFAGINASKNQ